MNNPDMGAGFHYPAPADRFITCPADAVMLAAAHFGVDPLTALHTPMRGPECDARACAVYLVRQVLGYSLSQLGWTFNYKDTKSIRRLLFRACTMRNLIDSMHAVWIDSVLQVNAI